MSCAFPFFFLLLLIRLFKKENKDIENRQHPENKTNKQVIIVYTLTDLLPSLDEQVHHHHLELLIFFDS